jgi:hypothetical protein
MARARRDARRHALVLFLSLAAATCSRTSDPADGEWTVPQTIDGGAPGEDVWLAGNSAGEAVAVWTSRAGSAPGNVLAARYTHAGAWSAPVVLGSGSAPRAVLDDAGNAFVLWTGASSAGQSILWRRSLQDGGWGGVETVPGAQSARWAVARTGAALLAWTTADGVFARDFDPAAGWAPAARIGSIVPMPGVLASLSLVEAFVSADGSAAVLWSQGYASPPRTQYSYWRGAHRAERGPWRAEEDLPELDGEVRGDEQGQVLVVWYDTARAVARFARLTPAGGWRPPQDVGTPAGFVPTSLAVAASGRGVLILSDQRDRLASVAFDPAAGWGHEDVLSSATVGPSLFDVRGAVEGSGAALALWTQAEDGHAAAMWAAPAAPWGARELITPDARHRPGTCPGDIVTLGARRPAMVVDDAGNALAVWIDLDCGGIRIRSSRRAVLPAWQDLRRASRAGANVSRPRRGAERRS